MMIDNMIKLFTAFTVALVPIVIIGVSSGVLVKPTRQ